MEPQYLLLTAMCGIPLLLGMPGFLLLVWGSSIQLRHMESEQYTQQADARLLGNFVEHLIGREKDLWQSLTAATESAHKLKWQSKLLIYPGAALLWVLAQYLKLPLLPYYLLRWLFRRNRQHTVYP